MSFSRRTLLKASAASAVLGGIGAPLVARAQTAEFTYKYANNLPDGHPMNARAKEMAAGIKAETNGRFDLQIFPEKLRSAGFYAEWKGKYGDQAWELLEKSVGKLS